MSTTEAATSLTDKRRRDPAFDLSPWCSCRLKRALDLICVLILIPATLPLMAIVALLVKTTSPGPVLFRQTRVGKGGIDFQLLKFRTMYHERRNVGSSLTQRGDPRIVPVGRVLRKWKLDELPQLFNVLRGEMSLVGPRPDLPSYLEKLRAEERLVLILMPGITGAACLQFRNEEVLLAQIAKDRLESFYVNTLLPQKIALELEYARNASIFTDVVLLFRTAAAIFW